MWTNAKRAGKYGLLGHSRSTKYCRNIDAKQRILESSTTSKQIVAIAESCVFTLQNGGKTVFAGNGGSFGDAQRLAPKFVSRLRRERNPLPAIALGANSSTFSAIANDCGYENVLERELTAIAERNDVFIAISTSGNNANVVRSIEAAKARDIRVYALTGDPGGRLASLCNCLKVPSASTAHVQECHIMIGHILVELAEGYIFES